MKRTHNITRTFLIAATLLLSLSYVAKAQNKTNNTPGSQSEQLTSADTLAEFRLLFDRNALPVYTSKESETQKDSSTYASIQSKPRFYKNFECGRVGQIRFFATDTCTYSYEICSEYDPLNPIDTTVAPSSRWFYFLITGVKGKQIAIQLRHTDPRAAVYSYDKVTWQRYDPLTEATKDRRLTKTYTRDSVYIAYYVPYTNTHLEQMMEEWQYRNGVKVFSVGNSYQGRDMKMLVVTNDYVPDSQKKRIYIHGRVHPSETPCSWSLEGLIDYLTGSSKDAYEIRNQTVFYILPFSNPDGVALGHSRCDAIGVNMEINYDRPDSLTRPEVKNIKNFINTTTYGGNHLDMFLNFHSQIAPHFTYWVHTPESTSEKYYKDLLTFSNLTISGSPYMNNECLSFSKVAPRYLEGYFWNYAGDRTLAITHETPYCYYNKDEESHWVTVDNLKEIGIKTLFAICEYFGISTSERVVVMPQSNRKCYERQSDDFIYIGDSYLEAKKDKTKVVYKLHHLNKGVYKLYRWSVGKKQRASDEGENLWVEAETHIQEKNGSFEYTVIADKGEKINAILLVKQSDENN